MARRNELWNVDDWNAASRARQLAVVAELLKGDEHLEVRDGRVYPAGGTRIVTVHDRKRGLDFCVIPGGTFEMGLSEEEETTLRSVDTRTGFEDYDEGGEEAYVEQFLSAASTMRPVREVTVPPFLLARFPLTMAVARRFLELDPSRRRTLGKADGSLASLHPDEIDKVLEAVGCRLPSESEWEYAYRAGSASVFPWGEEVLDAWEYADRASIPEEMDGWGAVFSDEQVCLSAANAFGLVSMGAVPEVCADAWHSTFHGAPTDGSPWIGGVDRVVRGGAAEVFPWQGYGEWLLLASAKRSSRSAKVPTALRPARSLGGQGSGD
jgi:formylglycine-generating enzyme required for sulfatase activity